jgi:hypothetical protein
VVGGMFALDTLRRGILLEYRLGVLVLLHRLVIHSCALPRFNVPGLKLSVLDPPPPASADGVYLVNSSKNGQNTSGFAWYSHIGNNDGTQPDAYIDIDTTSCVTWEGNSFSGMA